MCVYCRVVFRDLKPENVARNHHGAFQLLDFGLAKELKASDRVQHLQTFCWNPTRQRSDTEISSLNDDCNEADNYRYCQTHDPLLPDDSYRLTGLTGTVRIMSPEVIQCQAYGLPTDVYSFGIVLWEVFAGKRNNLTAGEVVKGQRPSLPVEGMPNRLQSLIRKCNGLAVNRPTFAMLCQEMEYQLLELEQNELEQEDDEYACLEHAGLSSTFQRFDYLRQLSAQSSLAMASTSTPM